MQTDIIGDTIDKKPPIEPWKAKLRKLLTLFLTNLYISAFTFGGGFVIVTFMKKQFVDKLHYINEQEMMDLTALAQSAPGAIAVNAAILVGWRVGGILGVLSSVLGTIIPPVGILIGISFAYNAFATNFYVALVLKGLQVGVAAVIIDVVISLGLKVCKKKSLLHIMIMVAAFVASFIFKINVIFIVLSAIVIGIVSAVIRSIYNKHTKARWL